MNFDWFTSMWVVLAIFLWAIGANVDGLVQLLGVFA